MVQRLLRRLLLIPVLAALVNAASFLIVTYLAEREHTLLGSVPMNAVVSAYTAYLERLLRGDLGSLPRSGDSIAAFVLDTLPNSLVLLVLALFVALLAGIITGTLAVNRHTRQASTLTLIISLVGFSMPAFYFGIVALFAMILLSGWLGQNGTILPSGGYGLDEHLVLPVLVLAARPGAEISRVVAELIADELHKDYVRAARARGLPWRLVLLRHALSNIASTVIITTGNAMRYVFSSLLIVETMFLWPGLGRALAATLIGVGVPHWQFHAPLAAAVFTVLALLFLITDLAADMLVQAIDPRLRLEPD